MALEVNLISVEILDETVTTAVASLKQIETDFSFAKTLLTEDKVGLAKVGAKMIEFNKKTYDYALKNEHLRVSYMDLTEMGRDVDATEKLKMVINHLVPLASLLNDTLCIVAAESYLQARVFYHHVKNAAKLNVPGASAIAKELSKLYYRRPPAVKGPSQEEKTEKEKTSQK